MRLGESELDFLSINMPPVCPYRCEFCLSGINGSRIPTGALSRTEIERLIQDAQSLGAFHIEISGEGEPLVYQRMLEDVISFASFRGIHTTIFSSGFLLTRELLEFLSRTDTSLAISLDYMDRERYEQFTGRPDSFESVMQSIALAREIFRDRIIESSGFRVMPLAIHSIVTRGTIPEIPLIREFCGEDIFFSVAPMMSRGSATSRPELTVSREETESIIRQYSHGSLIVSDTSIDDIGQETCGTFCYGIGIRYDGSILFDAHAYETAGLLGSIRGSGLHELVQRLREMQSIYFETYSDGGFCPLRDPGFSEFVTRLRGDISETRL